MRNVELVYTHALLLEAREYLVRRNLGQGAFEGVRLDGGHPDGEPADGEQPDRHPYGEQLDEEPFVQAHPEREHENETRPGSDQLVPQGAFAEYDAHPVRPHHVHRGKEAHREAIHRLLEGFRRVGRPQSRTPARHH